nr:ORF2 [Torque teno felis virus]
MSQTSSDIAVLCEEIKLTPARKKLRFWSPEDERRKLHEAIWKQSCSRTHQLWCTCGNWVSHINPCIIDVPDGDGGEDGGKDPVVKIDAFGRLVDTREEAR